MTQFETLDRLSEAVSMSLADYLTQRQRVEKGQRVEIVSARIRDKDLRGVDFSGMNLWGLGTVGVDFTGANFRRTTLRHAMLKDTDLTGADFAGADLSSVRFFRGTTFKGAKFNRANLTHAHFFDPEELEVEVDFTGARRLKADGWIPGWDAVRGRLRVAVKR